MTFFRGTQNSVNFLTTVLNCSAVSAGTHILTREDLTEKGHFGSSILNFETLAPLADECAVLADCQMKLQYKLKILCSIIHTLLKLHLKHFINTEARKLAIVHVAISFLTIQTLDGHISTFFTSYYSVLFTCLHTCG